jgi:5-methylcytosine-specific restriction protein A
MPDLPPAFKPRPGRAPDNRPSASKRGYGRAWSRLRLACLTRDPICVMCRERASRHADHIKPRNSGGADALSNLQGLCGPCHSVKTCKEDGGFGNAKR